MQWKAGYERIDRCAKHADAVRERKPRRKPRKKLRPNLRKNKLQRLIQFYDLIIAGSARVRGCFFQLRSDVPKFGLCVREITRQ
jgi:hypothetical protein